MDKWLFKIELDGGEGTSINLKIPYFPEGDKFDRWARGNLKIITNNLSYISTIDFEYSDICELADVLSKIEPDKQTQWQAMEERLSINLEASALGTVLVTLSVKNNNEATRFLQVVVETTLSNIETISKKLNRIIL